MTPRFKQLVGDTKCWADDDPVLLTDRGQPAYALPDINGYHRLQGKQLSLADMLAQADSDADSEADYEFDAPRIQFGFKPANSF